MEEGGLSTLVFFFFLYAISLLSISFLFLSVPPVSAFISSLFSLYFLSIQLFLLLCCLMLLSFPSCLFLLYLIYSLLSLYFIYFSISSFLIFSFTFLSFNFRLSLFSSFSLLPLSPSFFIYPPCLYSSILNLLCPHSFLIIAVKLGKS